MARDIFHDAVRHALEKDGWTITHDPLTIILSHTNIQIDLGAERLIAAEKNHERIAIEVKAFNMASFTTAFHQALGQFLNYRLQLGKREPERVLYLAVPKDTFDAYFESELVEDAVNHYAVNFLIYNSQTEEIQLWVKH
jgi:XisH protein